MVGNIAINVKKCFEKQPNNNYFTVPVNSHDVFEHNTRQPINDSLDFNVTAAPSTVVSQYYCILVGFNLYIQTMVSVGCGIKFMS